jgi:hypothetical protein
MKMRLLFRQSRVLSIFAGTMLFLTATFCWLTIPSRAALDDDPSGSKVVVTRALFGSGLKVQDVTQRVVDLLRTEPNGFSVRTDWLRDDPAPGKPKALAITYDYKGKHYLFVTASKEKVSNEILIENARKSEQPPPTKAL